MTTYNMGFFNDMGHLNFQSNLPKEIEIKVYKKIYNDYIDMATDLNGIGVRYYILKPNVEKNFTCTFDSYTIEVNLEDLPYFNPATMKSINLNYSKRLLNLL
jgi:hypothetical protein